MILDWKASPGAAKLLLEIFDVLDADTGKPLHETYGLYWFADDEAGVVMGYDRVGESPNIFRAEPRTGEAINRAHRANIKFVPKGDRR